MSNDTENTIITNLIREYYKGVTHIAPEKIEQREFGVGTFDTKIAFRHIAIKDEMELNEYLVKNAPPYISYSSAYYKFPAGRPMESKGWLGSELVFDLDASDMKLRCQLTHDRSWVCEKCLEGVREEAVKLVEDFLIPDFGFSKEEIQVNFSGNRGYHVHIKESSVLQLDSYARSEISDYISGNNIKFEEFFPTSGIRGRALLGPKESDKGWGGKIARSMIANVEKGPDALISLGINVNIAKNLYKKKALFELGIKNGNWDMIYIKDKAEFWKRIVENQSINQSDKIDRNVTKDPGHLIRLPDTINSEGGLLAKKIKSVNDMVRFNPMNDAIAFANGTMKVKADTNYPLIMKNETFGPYKNEELELPVYVAVYLYLKGLAHIINTSQR